MMIDTILVSCDNKSNTQHLALITQAQQWAKANVLTHINATLCYLFVYEDASGQPVYFKYRKHVATDDVPTRKETKEIRAFHHDGIAFKSKEPDYHTAYPEGDGKKPLFLLPRLNTADVVYLVEGEQKADALTKLGFVATTSGGANSVHTTYWQPLAHKTVIVWRDNDNAGLTYQTEVSNILLGLGSTVYCIDVEALNLPPKGDVMDWLEARQGLEPEALKRDIEALPRLPMQADNAQQIEPVHAEMDVVQRAELEIQRLAALPSLTYSLQRKDAAKRLGIGCGELDKFVQAEQGKTQDNTGIETTFNEPEPWECEVNGRELLDDIINTIHRYIVCSDETTIAAALWVMFTWCIDAFNVAPIACITAPEKRCGKSQLLMLLGRMAAKPLPVSNITPSVIFRVLEDVTCTLLIAEADTFIKDNEEMRGIINSGHTRDTAYVLRCTGDDHKPARFSTWGAKAISGIGHLPDTIRDRSVILELRRKTNSEVRARLRHGSKEATDLIQRKLARWANDNVYTLRYAQPNLPEALNDRAQDNWEALLAIADLCDFGQKARHAALHISGNIEAEPTVGEQLLADIKTIFEREGIKHNIGSADLLLFLCSDEEMTWATYNRGKPMSVHQLAKKLKPYKLSPKQIRQNNVTKKGYTVSEFNTVFSLYLSSLPVHPQKSETPIQPSNINAYTLKENETMQKDVSTPNSLKVLEIKGCNDVSTRNAPPEENKKNEVEKGVMYL